MMNRKTWIALAIAATLVAVIAFLAVVTKAPKRPAEYRIGAVLAQTDRGATYGKRALNGMLLATDEVNRRDFFRGHALRLIVEDSQSKATQALSAFQKLIDQDHVPVAVGFVLSDEVLSCAPVADKRKVVLFSTAAGSDKIKDAGDYVFRNRESAALQAEVIASACVKRFGIRQVGVLHSNSANGISYRDAFVSAAQRLGATIVGTVAYNEGKTDYRAEIQQLKAKSPAGVYLAGLDQELGLILKQSSELAFAPRFFASAGAVSQKVIDIAGRGAEGLVCGSAPFDPASSDGHMRAFTTAFRARFGEEPDFIAANSYDAIVILADILQRGARGGEEIKRELYRVKDYPGVGGLTTFDSYGEVIKPVLTVQVRNGRFTPMGEMPNGNR